MECSFSNGTARVRESTTSLARVGAGTVISLVIAGLLAEVVNHEEAFAGMDHGLFFLALLGAAGCIVSFTGRLSSNPDPLPGAGFVHGPGPSAALPVVGVRGEDWPVLVALLFGAITGLISGLGGWV
jgi:hypothetical protein